MNRESENALQLLTGKTNLRDVPLEELQQLADAHPYFAAVQLLLAQKMQHAYETDLQKQLQKTALYFPNQQWLRYLLFEPKEKITGTITATAEQQDEQVQDEFTDTEAVIVTEEPEIDTELIAEIEENKTETEDTHLITLLSEQILQDISDTESITSEPEEIPLDDEELQQQSDPLPLDESNQKIASLLSGQAEQFSKPVEDKTEVSIAAEPFHTVDYFASQGIRLDAKREENQFDKKVHKFTDWLRQMKRINPHPVDLGTETEEETFIASIADSSNHTKAILTESMADVLLKQGKGTKAIEIYQKLSLLNPDKSTYFAALIQKIK